MKQTTKRLLIANRGEIAIRIARTARALGFETVALYSDADRFAEHVRHCDYAVGIGGSVPKENYLDVDKVIAAAKQMGATYIHPGYGFLSERPHFADACKTAGITFVGPTAESMRLMGDKIQARATIDDLGLPRVPGSKGAVKDASEAKKVAGEIGYPVLLKAAAGGGGKGMRRVDSDSELSSSFQSAFNEAQSAFGDGSMYVEKFILEPHHVEIQVFGDGKGGGVHLGERECSIQRRHQKVWEETPAPILNQHPDTRTKMFEAALKITQAVKYAGAGTLEFIVDGKGNFYFLEMNTRLQVEHPVTEWVTGVDLVAWQIKLAEGTLVLPKTNPERRGASVEVRLYAEDPVTFLPAPGKLGAITLPQGPFVRSDSAFTESGEVSLFYDPMIAKVSTWGNTRDEAIARLRVALDETRVQGPKKSDYTSPGALRTNLTFLSRLVRHPRVLKGDTTTDLIANAPDLTAAAGAVDKMESALALALAQAVAETRGIPSAEVSSGSLASPWKTRAIQEAVRS